MQRGVAFQLNMHSICVSISSKIWNDHDALKTILVSITSKTQKEKDNFDALKSIHVSISSKNPQMWNVKQ